MSVYECMSGSVGCVWVCMSVLVVLRGSVGCVGGWCECMSGVEGECEGGCVGGC